MKSLKSLKAPKILYFTKGRAPTKEDRAAVEKLGVPVSYRNAAYIDPDSPLEPCAGVAGAVPKQYRDEFEHAAKVVAEYGKAVKKHNDELKKLDTPAPETPPVDPSKEPANGTGETPPAQLQPPEGWKTGN